MASSELALHYWCEHLPLPRCNEPRMVFAANGSTAFNASGPGAAAALMAYLGGLAAPWVRVETTDMSDFKWEGNLADTCFVASGGIVAEPHPDYTGHGGGGSTDGAPGCGGLKCEYFANLRPKELLWAALKRRHLRAAMDGWDGNTAVTWTPCPRCGCFRWPRR